MLIGDFHEVAFLPFPRLQLLVVSLVAVFVAKTACLRVQFFRDVNHLIVEVDFHEYHLIWPDRVFPKNEQIYEVKYFIIFVVFE